MITPCRIKVVIVLVSMVVMLPTLRAGIAEFDNYLLQKAEEAKQASLEAFHPDPMNVTDHFNHQVHLAFEGSNDTRRSLRRYSGPCLATNPIDRCWRCDPNWAKNRKKLAGCVIGFGRKTTGGLKGQIYVVTDPSDNDFVNPKPGTLRFAAVQQGPLWITFGRSMIITLAKELLVTSDKTIDARGANVHIANGAGISIQFAQNVIIHGLHIHHIIAATGGMIRDNFNHVGMRTVSDGDGVSIFGSSNIWLDHLSMSNCQDGLIDAIQGSTGITISNSHFTHHNDVMLFGASESYQADSVMQVTVAFNHFGKGLVQRMPRCRFGFFHVVNNDYTHWLMYAIGGSQHPTIISQGNRFIAPNNPAAAQITNRNYATEAVWKTWIWRSEGDLMMNGAFFVPSGNPRQNLGVDWNSMVKAKPGTFVTSLTRFSGALSCYVGRPC